MPYLSKVVLHCISGIPKGLPQLVEAFIEDGVKFVGVVGKDAALIEDLIDECVVGDGADEQRFILTSNHEGETLDDAMEFANCLTGEYEGKVQLIEV
jgi:hypothetical protein